MPNVRTHYNHLNRLWLLFTCCLVPSVFTLPANAVQVADGMTLLRQKMPANYCALTFDDGPGRYTATLLDLLAERKIPATFFVVGQNAERRPALIKRMLAEGHEVANHSYSHPKMNRLKPEDQFLEMKRTQDVLHALGAEVRHFRPPYGHYTQETVAMAESLGMTIVLWCLDSRDWQRRHVSRLEGLLSVSPTVQRSFPGIRGVLLFHDTHKHTVDEMADILDALVASGCERFVTVSEYMLKAPHEAEQHLSIKAPNEGRGEMPLSSLTEQKQFPSTDGVLSLPLEDAQNQRISNVMSMRTQAAHPAETQRAGMRMQAAHGIHARSLPAAPEVLAIGIETNEQTTDVAHQAQIRRSVPLALMRSTHLATPYQPPKVR